MAIGNNQQNKKITEKPILSRSLERAGNPWKTQLISNFYESRWDPNPDEELLVDVQFYETRLSPYPMKELLTRMNRRPLIIQFLWNQLNPNPFEEPANSMKHQCPVIQILWMNGSYPSWESILLCLNVLLLSLH